MQYPFQVWELEVGDYKISHLDSHFIISSQHLGNRFQKFQSNHVKGTMTRCLKLKVH